MAFITFTYSQVYISSSGLAHSLPSISSVVPRPQLSSLFFTHRLSLAAPLIYGLSNAVNYGWVRANADAFVVNAVSALSVLVLLFLTLFSSLLLCFLSFLLTGVPSRSRHTALTPLKTLLTRVLPMRLLSMLCARSIMLVRTSNSWCSCMLLFSFVLRVVYVVSLSHLCWLNIHEQGLSRVQLYFSASCSNV